VIVHRRAVTVVVTNAVELAKLLLPPNETGQQPEAERSVTQDDPVTDDDTIGGGTRNEIIGCVFSSLCLLAPSSSSSSVMSIHGHSCV